MEADSGRPTRQAAGVGLDAQAGRYVVVGVMGRRFCRPRGAGHRGRRVLRRGGTDTSSQQNRCILWTPTLTLPTSKIIVRYRKHLFQPA